MSGTSTRSATMSLSAASSQLCSLDQLHDLYSLHMGIWGSQSTVKPSLQGEQLGFRSPVPRLACAALYCMLRPCAITVLLDSTPGHRASMTADRVRSEVVDAGAELIVHVGDISVSCRTTSNSFRERCCILSVLTCPLCTVCGWGAEDLGDVFGPG